ncbi:MAG: hypothetical protein M1813_004299 [Trichoglossum hirsutum]|nr:MAG: hypothetical protein M1813_004299 [Trichoglossum hirsutum]
MPRRADDQVERLAREGVSNIKFLPPDGLPMYEWLILAVFRGGNGAVTTAAPPSSPSTPPKSASKTKLTASSAKATRSSWKAAMPFGSSVSAKVASQAAKEIDKGEFCCYCYHGEDAV